MSNISHKQLETITRTIVEILEKEKEKERKVKHDRRLHNTKLLMKNYRSFKKHSANLRLDIADLNKKLDLDELDTDEFAIKSIKRSKERTLATVKFIDQMITIYRVMSEQSGREEDKRIYQSIYQLYISDEKMSASQIATCHKTDVRTVYRDVNKACETLSALVFGVDSLRFY